MIPYLLRIETKALSVTNDYIPARMAGSNGIGRYTFEEGRIYTDGDIWVPSVSEVLAMRADPPGLKKWKQRKSQAEQDQRTFYTQNRGTLLHYHMLSQLTDEEFWSDDEQDSEDCLRGRREHRGTGLTGDYETWQRFQSDKEWTMEAWEMIRRIYNIHPENTLDVELYVKNEAVGYAGQFDLLYADGSDVVLADLKTSKRVYDKHLIQSVAYAHAVDVTVDRMEIIRINPDGETWEVSSSEDWIEDPDDLWAEFVELRDSMEEARIERLKEKAQSEHHTQDA